MDLGAFSVSLAVQDMAQSRAFYENLGFDIVGGDGTTWTIVANQTTVIGLFHGMFEDNILTFNPGWEGIAEASDDFTDVRELSNRMEGLGINTIEDNTRDTSEGPASFMLTDPDGNVILFDQHV
jgi:catechol 2,3-dioxygenase-like lactoylglutathione lyase family enzyme